MKEEQDYIRDIAEIRSMMERSSKFLSLSGWAGIMAGIYGLAGVYIAYSVFHFYPVEIFDSTIGSGGISPNLLNVIVLAVIVLIMAIGTAIFLSHKKAVARGERLWNPTAKRLVVHMAVPLVVGGLLILIMIAKGMIGLIAPFSLLFYGLAIYNASNFTFEEMKILGLTQIGLGLISAYFVQYGILCWALGFGVLHIIYGIYMHYRYEK
ncbi:hypothetical protein [Negadavirga shengliensis]|uniref:Uncharacterized protein n=1 Tax=Negadavirga shengliensis TaxID=1389218 RepID=A0ABV9SZX1_9BACT